MTLQEAQKIAVKNYWIHTLLKIKIIWGQTGSFDLHNNGQWKAVESVQDLINLKLADESYLRLDSYFKTLPL